MLQISAGSNSGLGLQYKFTNFDNKLVKWVLERHSMTEAIDSEKLQNAHKKEPELFYLGNNQVSLIWSSSVIKQNMYAGLGRFQKINHFPRSYEITRKDCLYNRFSRM